MTLYEITEQKLNYFKYANNTVKNYLHYIDEFESSLNKHYSRITAKDIQNYIDDYKFTSTSQQNQIISALKFSWEKSLGKKYLKIDFRRPRKQRPLPKIIDKDLLKNTIPNIKNLKHRSILMLAYSCGLRVSEVINLKIEHIQSNRGLILIENAKGNKDRYVPLSGNVLKTLREYFSEYRPKTYLFNGQKSLKYSATSCNKIVKKYLGNDYHFHQLRHSSFTTMLESGTDIRIIQKIAGHRNPSTTTIYTHVSNQFLSQVNTPI